jgi:hypothetical protein
MIYLSSIMNYAHNMHKVAASCIYKYVPLVIIKAIEVFTPIAYQI